jgi:hypothetical protein
MQNTAHHVMPNNMYVQAGNSKFNSNMIKEHGKGLGTKKGSFGSRTIFKHKNKIADQSAHTYDNYNEGYLDTKVNKKKAKKSKKIQTSYDDDAEATDDLETNEIDAELPPAKPYNKNKKSKTSIITTASVLNNNELMPLNTF